MLAHFKSVRILKSLKLRNNVLAFLQKTRTVPGTLIKRFIRYLFIRLRMEPLLQIKVFLLKKENRPANYLSL